MSGADPLWKESDSTVRVWTKSACVVFAWGSIVVIVVVAAGLCRPGRPPRVNIGTARSTTKQITGPAAARGAAVPAAGPGAGYVVQPGDTLSGIAAALGVRGGWPALYAANRRVIGPDPDVIDPGAVLALPGAAAPTKYTVAAGDTLSAIAAALAVRGGWPALYAANRRVIGPDPALIRPGTILAIPRPAAAPAAPRPPRSGRPAPPGPPPGPGPGHPVPPGPPPGTPGSRPRPGLAVPAAGMPGWLTAMLAAAALLTATAFLTEPVLVIRRRRRAAARALTPAAAGPAPGPAGPPAPGTPPAASPPRPPAGEPPGQQPPGGGPPGSGPPGAGRTRIVVADYPRLVVTRSAEDGTIYLLRPPGQDPAAILRVARLILPEQPYRQLARQLGLPASWPILLADYDRLVVTCSARDGTICVLRPPGQDPAAVLKAARLVLPEEPYEELAEMLDLPASWPLQHTNPGPPG